MTGLPKPLTLYPRETLNKRQLQKNSSCFSLQSKNVILNEHKDILLKNLHYQGYLQVRDVASYSASNC